MGRVFSKHLYRAILGVTSPNHFVRVTADICDDFLIWHKFLYSFNGCALWQAPFCVSSVLNIFTDASGACGYRAFCQGHWSANKWYSSWIDKGFTTNIVLLELLPVLVSLELWGTQENSAAF